MRYTVHGIAEYDLEFTVVAGSADEAEHIAKEKVCDGMLALDTPNFIIHAIDEEEE